MASYLRPRRGKKSAAEQQGIILMRGEIFFEYPESGTGTGVGKIKMGDGVTSYSALPYFMQQTDVDSTMISFSDSSTATDSSNDTTYLSNIKPSNDLKTIFTNLKQLLFNYNKEIKDNKTNIEQSKTYTDQAIEQVDQKIQQDIPFKLGIDGSGNYGYYKAGADTVTPFKNYSLNGFDVLYNSIIDNGSGQTLSYRVTESNRNTYKYLIFAGNGTGLFNVWSLGADGTVNGSYILSQASYWNHNYGTRYSQNNFALQSIRLGIGVMSMERIKQANVLPTISVTAHGGGFMVLGIR